MAIELCGGGGYETSKDTPTLSDHLNAIAGAIRTLPYGHQRHVIQEHVEAAQKLLDKPSAEPTGFVSTNFAELGL